MGVQTPMDKRLFRRGRLMLIGYYEFSIGLVQERRTRFMYENLIRYLLRQYINGIVIVQAIQRGTSLQH